MAPLRARAARTRGHRPRLRLAALAALSLAAACGAAPAPGPAELTAEERAWLAAHGPLRFAPDPNFPPLEWFDESGAYRGLVADLFQRLQARLGVRVEIVRAATWDDVLRRARDRAVDGITAAQPTPERSAYLDWTPPILDLPNVVIVRTESLGDASLAGLEGRRVAVTRGNALEEYLRADYPTVRVVPLPDDLACLTQVSFGDVDAAVVNLAIATWLIERHGISNLRVGADSGRHNPLAIATRNDQPLLRSIMAKGLAAVTEAEREEIQGRWLHVRADDLIPRRTLVLILVAGLAALGLALGSGLAWNRALRRQVAAATAELRAELAERHRAEAALRRSERKLSLHLAQTVVAVIEFDLDFHVAYWNTAAERIFGWTRAELEGRPALPLVPPEERAAVAEVWRGLEARRSGWHIVARNLTKDGRTIRCEWFNTTLLADDGRVTGVMSLAFDVSERERREEAQARVQRLESLAVLAGGIAHDFNNLLTGVLANLSLLLADDPPAEERTQLAQEAEAAARRAQALTRQLLTFSRGGAPAKALLDAAAVVREAALFAARGATGTCRFEFAADLWLVEADAGQLSQVVHNLVLNALEARSGGTVAVALDNLRLEQARGPLLPGEHVRLRVSDQGPGIPPEVLPRIFDPFFSTKRRGSGLGLAVTHSIVARHGGLVEARSAPGQGATFEVTLPASPGARPSRERPAAQPEALAARVLVMDDEEPICRVAQRVLGKAGCEVVTCADGAEAVGRWRAALEGRAPFDVAILDLTVPGGMGGAEALAALRAIDPGVRAIVSSGYSNAAIVSDPAAHGFAAVVHKPWSADELRRVVAEVCARGAPPH